MGRPVELVSVPLRCIFSQMIKFSPTPGCPPCLSLVRKGTARVRTHCEVLHDTEGLPDHTLCALRGESPIIHPRGFPWSPSWGAACSRDPPSLRQEVLLRRGRGPGQGPLRSCLARRSQHSSGEEPTRGVCVYMCAHRERCIFSGQLT